MEYNFELLFDRVSLFSAYSGIGMNDIRVSGIRVVEEFYSVFYQKAINEFGA